jgi:transposase
MTKDTHNEKLEAEQNHLRVLVDRLVREGHSEKEIARAVDRAASPDLRNRKAA